MTATRPNTLYRQIALFTLGKRQGAEESMQAAIEHYSAAQGIASALQSNAALGTARCAEQMGDTQTAVATYKEYLKDKPRLAVRDQAR